MSLLSAKIYHHMKKTVTFGQKVHAHPFVWNEKLDRPGLSRSKRGRLIWLANAGFATFHVCFVILQCLRVEFGSSSNKIKKMYMRFVVANVIFALVAQIANLLNQNEFPGFFYKFSTLMKQFESM